MLDMSWGNHLFPQWFFGLTAALIVAQALLWKSKRAAWIIFIVFPIVLSYLWFQHSHPLFAWIKMYSVLGGGIWLLILRDTKLCERRWARNIGAAILFLNILEATVTDFTSSQFTNGFNGILLLATLPGASAISTQGEKTKVLMYQLTVPWILGYTLWNLSFILFHFPQYAGYHIAVLGVPLFALARHPAMWLQSRVFILAVYLMYEFTFPALPSTAHWYDYRLCLALSKSWPATAKWQPMLQL